GRALRRTCRPLARRLRRGGLLGGGCGLAVGQLPATAAPATLARRPCGVAFARAGNGIGRGRFGLRTRGALGAGRCGGVGGRRGVGGCRVVAARATGAAAALATAAFTAAATAAAARAGAPATAATALLVGRALLARLLEDRADAFLFAVVTLDRLALRAWQGDQQVGLHRRGRELLFDVRLDVRQAHRVALAGEADRVPLGAQAGGAADAVDVVLGVERQVVVVDVRHAVDVQAARGDVGRHQQLQLALLELVEQRLALLLRHVAAEHADPVPAALQRTRDPLDPHLGVDEHHRAGALAAREQAQQQRDLFLVGREVHHLADLGRGDGLGLDHQLLGLVHVLVGEFEHAVAQRRREQQRLPLGPD